MNSLQTIAISQQFKQGYSLQLKLRNNSKCDRATEETEIERIESSVIQKLQGTKLTDKHRENIYNFSYCHSCLIKIKRLNILYELLYIYL